MVSVFPDECYLNQRAFPACVGRTEWLQCNHSYKQIGWLMEILLVAKSRTIAMINNVARANSRLEVDS